MERALDQRTNCLLFPALRTEFFAAGSGSCGVGADGGSMPESGAAGAMGEHSSVASWVRGYNISDPTGQGKEQSRLSRVFTDDSVPQRLALRCRYDHCSSGDPGVFYYTNAGPCARYLQKKIGGETGQGRCVQRDANLRATMPYLRIGRFSV